MQDIVLGRLNADLWPATSVGTQHFVFPEFASEYRTHPGVLDKLSYATDILALQKCLGKR